MKRIDIQDFDRSSCPVFRSVGEIGDRWSLLIVRECFLGTRRFDDFRSNLGISKSVLANKIQQLLADQILEKREYQEPQQRPRSEYRLTHKGKDLYLVIISLMEWGNKYLTAGSPQLLTVTERQGEAVGHLHLVSEQGHPLERKDIQLTAFEKG
jgi:DNA-binding HxlR family transcriptional regulator